MQEVFADTLTPWRDALLSVKYISLDPWEYLASNFSLKKLLIAK